MANQGIKFSIWNRLPLHIIFIFSSLFAIKKNFQKTLAFFPKTRYLICGYGIRYTVSINTKFINHDAANKGGHCHEEK